MSEFTNITDFDPYSMIMNRVKDREAMSQAQQYIPNPEAEEELKAFCQKHGILGVNFGNMNPSTILNKLKQEIGYKEEQKKNMLLG